MPEEKNPPKTVPEIGIHLFYMSEAIKAVQATLKEIKYGTVSRIEFDDHTDWGKKITDDHEKRIKSIEDTLKVEDLSLSKRVMDALDKKVVAIIVVLLLGSIGWSIYMSIKYQVTVKDTPIINVQ